MSVRSPIPATVVGPGELLGFRAGDPDAVRAVYRVHGRFVFAVAYRALGSRQLAEDATQQTFVNAWRAAGRFDPARDLRPWLAAIARRAAIDVHRREARRPTERLDDAAADRPAAAVVDTEFDVWAVREAIDDLPPLEREVVRLHHLESLTQAEIGVRLGVPVGTVKSRSFRAHRQLAARLGHLRSRSQRVIGSPVAG
jgi:RNA polymerase sigma-70 factor (ECF subfamily)